MNLFQRLILKKELSKTRNKSFLFLDNVNSVIVYINNESQKDLVSFISDQLNIKVDIIYFNLRKDLRIDNFNKKDFNLFYRIKNEELTSILSKSYDLFINLTTEDNFYNYFISNVINATFKVGSSFYNSSLIDFDFTLLLKKNNIDENWCKSLIKNLSE